MKHFMIDADPDLIPYFEDLYDNQGYDFALQYGIGPHYLLNTAQENFYALVLQQKGAREIAQSQIQESFLNLKDALWLGNENLLQREL
jgi:hypothetical protein